jgi:DNA (cytosine-5)-methyltransferase 1
MPRLLDLFCCQGGAGTGYHRAGFDVVGVDIDAQPLYPFPFHQGDALEVLRDLLLSDILGTPVILGGVEYMLQDFDAIHASPPCQAYSTITPDKSKHPELIEPVREFLIESGLPYVIENVDGAKRELIDPVMLCGSSFGLRVRRHRWFESNTPILTMPCQHATQGQPVGVYGDHPDARQVLRPDGRSRGAKATSVDDARDAMGMPWADWAGCAEAIPPAYCEHIGRQLIDHLTREEGRA